MAYGIVIKSVTGMFVVTCYIRRFVMKQGKVNRIVKVKIGLIVYSLSILIGLVGCADTEFSQKPPKLVVQDMSAGKVDLLFVVDNSGSMYVEQVKMADSFPKLLNDMELNGLDFRIAITTTDVISSGNPKKALGGLAAGSLQDGKLIKFPNGKLFLDNNSSNIESQFRATVQRKETLDCEGAKFEVSKCPSSDERGIYAANLAVRRNEGGFFRAGSHVAFVFLTDENERGNALNNPANRPELQPQIGDYPETLITSVYKNLGPSHTMSSHSILVADDNCRASQLYQIGNENILARIGTFYMSLSNPNNTSRLNTSVNLGSYAPGKLLYGTVGSICASNYTAQVGSILNILLQDANKYVSKADLDCIPEENTFKVESCPSGTSCSLSADKKSVNFYPSLAPNQTARVSYYCYK
jgi:hypothetical protein